MVRTFNGEYSRARSDRGGIFRRLDQAVKECARRNERDPLVFRKPEDLLRQWRPRWHRNEVYAHGVYRWRVLDLGSRTYVG